MNKSNSSFEIIVGTFVLLCASIFLFTSLGNSSITQGKNGYLIRAKFDNIEGISSGSDVKISGVKIGSVVNSTLDKNDFRAQLIIIVDPEIQIPVDSSVKVSSEGLLGSKYLSITPGADEKILQNNDEITFTQSSVNFEELLGKFIFGSKSEQSE